MDSLTQIVLGAAVGELTLGRKIGNRAILWGAIGGTIPDLDIIGNAFLSPVDALASHRGISHSITFAVVGALFFAYAVYYLYKWRKSYWVEWSLAQIFHGLITMILVLLFYQLLPLPAFIISGIAIAGVTLWGIGKIWKDYHIRRVVDAPKLRAWYILFFLAFLTHSLLDSFTAYGTQLFAPFSDYRVAFNNISVADPLYTLPYLIFLPIVSTLNRKDRRRRWLTSLTLIISSLYMGLTFINYSKAYTVLSNTADRKSVV